MLNMEKWQLQEGLANAPATSSFVFVRRIFCRKRKEGQIKYSKVFTVLSTCHWTAIIVRFHRPIQCVGLFYA